MSEKNRTAKIVQSICNAGEIPILLGNAGVGKTEIVKQIAEETGRELIILISSQMEPGDLIGMPARDLERKETAYLKPDWFPKDGNCILFLDEIGRTSTATRSAMLQLLTDRRLHNHRLPENTWIIAASNPFNDRFDQEDIYDDAFVDRFVWLSVMTDPDSWIEWAIDNVLDSSVIEFIRTESQHIGGREDFDMPDIKPSPRSWAKLSKIMKSMPENDFADMGFSIANGLLGPQAAQSFMETWKSRRQRMRAENLWEKTKDTLKQLTESEVHEVNEYVLKVVDFLKLQHKEGNLKKWKPEPIVQLMKTVNAESAAIIARELNQEDNIEIYDYLKKDEEFTQQIMISMTGSKVKVYSMKKDASGKKKLAEVKR